MPNDLPLRLTAFTIDAETGCWQWTGHVAANGYGKIGHGVLAHRAVYEIARGPIPPGLDLDHLCRNRRCVNPAHLEAVTRSVNLRRSPLVGGKSKTHCINGHLYDEANTYRRKAGTRDCNTCIVLRRERRRALIRTTTARVLRVPTLREQP